MKACLKLVCLFIVIAVGCNTIRAQMTLPEKAMGIPKVFLDEEESWNWDNIARNRDWGESSSQFWRVYIDRDGVKAHISPDASSKVVNTFNFMDKNDILYVAKIQNGFALLYKEKYEQTNLEISKKAKAQGWVSVDELLLWSTCPRTISQIYQKAVILKDVDALQNTRDINESSPEFSASPYEIIPTGRRANDLEFYFVYKMVDGAALLLEDNKITPTVNASKKGWMRSGLYTPWNDRLCYEPNFGEEVKGYETAVFSDNSSVRQFKSRGKILPEMKLLWKETLGTKRWAPKNVRFPVIKMNDNGYIATVGTISTFASSGGNTSKAEFERLSNKEDSIESKLRRINVVFVMDGTSSMRNYYQPMAKALTEAMSQNEMQGANMYFGAVVYRNYADEKENQLIEKKQLTQDYKSVANWLVSQECRSIGDSHYEAMFYGIETALDQMNWNKENCNFLVLVGDAANAMPDQRNKTIASISKKMAEKEINFVVFQANHLDHAAYHDFPIQVQKIMLSQLEKLTSRKISRSDFKLKNQVYNYKNSDPYMIISAGFRFAEINKSESESNLKVLVEDKIVDFKRQAEESLATLRMTIEGFGSSNDMTGFDEGAVEFLKRKGFTDEDIKLLKEKNTALKIKGYATRTTNICDVFTPCVFMAKPELDLLIQSLSSVNSNVSENPRKDLQDAIKNLALSYIGQNANTDDLEVDEVMEAVTGLTGITGRTVLSGINLKDITNPSKVSQAQINSFIQLIANDVEDLKNKRTDKSCYFDSSNDMRYYYILLEDMPLQ